MRISFPMTVVSVYPVMKLTIGSVLKLTKIRGTTV